MSITICIPSVRKDLNKKYIVDILNKFNFGKIKKIILVPNSYNENTVFIGYHYWFYNDKNQEIKKILNNKECFKIIHEFPWFWKCYKADKQL
jgi:hypothetical protein